MSANCTVILEKAENVVVVPKEAIQTANNANYVVVVNDYGTTENVTVETGISNDAYTEIKSGLNEGETVEYTVTTNNSSSNSFRGGGEMRFQNSGGGQMTMPSGRSNATRWRNGTSGKLKGRRVNK